MIPVLGFLVGMVVFMLAQGPCPWDYFSYEPQSVDELAEEDAYFEQDADADAELLEEGEAWARPSGRFL